MRIVDLALMPYEIEVHDRGIDLIKVGTVTTLGSANYGARKEVTLGYYGKGGVDACIEAIIRDKVVSDNEGKKVSLLAFLKSYEENRKHFVDLINKITRVPKITVPATLEATA